MSTSYQDIDVRLVGVENALRFVMDAMRVRVQIGSPLSAAPIIQEMSLYDYYRSQLSKGILEPVTEETNGTDSDDSDLVVTELE